MSDNFKKDRFGTNGNPGVKPRRITYLASANGYVMCRHPGAMPFVISEKTWRSFPLWQKRSSRDGGEPT